MDSNEALENIRALLPIVLTGVVPDSGDDDPADAFQRAAETLAEAVERLDESLSQGGPPPKAWVESASWGA